MTDLAFHGHAPAHGPSRRPDPMLNAQVTAYLGVVRSGTVTSTGAKGGREVPVRR